MDRNFGSLLDFGQFIARVAVGVESARHDALEEGAKILEAEAKSLIGHENREWPPLADSTVDEKEMLGYTGHVSATDPLLRTGELRDSYEHTVIDTSSAEVGSNDDKAVWHELGTRTVPPRPLLGTAVAAKGKEVAEVIGLKVLTPLVGRDV